jgi:hypothetical protein
MLDPVNGAAGCGARSQALQSTIDTLRKRLADFETRTELAASTDFPPGE